MEIEFVGGPLDGGRKFIASTASELTITEPPDPCESYWAPDLGDFVPSMRTHIYTRSDAEEEPQRFIFLRSEWR